MSGHQKVLTIPFSVGPDKVNAETRYDRGVKISTLAPQSPLYALPDVKAGVDTVVKSTTSLQAAMDSYAKARQAYMLARLTLGTSIVTFDNAYDMLVSAARAHCATHDDGAGLGLEPRGDTHNPLAMPVAVLITYNPKKDCIRIHVKRAKGMRAVSVEVTQDLTNPASWKELDGDGAVHVINTPATGTWYARAASKTAHAKSDYTTPSSVIVK
jgi:hypothetical protein